MAKNRCDRHPFATTVYELVTTGVAKVDGQKFTSSRCLQAETVSNWINSAAVMQGSKFLGGKATDSGERKNKTVT